MAPKSDLKVPAAHGMQLAIPTGTSQQYASALTEGHALYPVRPQCPSWIILASWGSMELIQNPRPSDNQPAVHCDLPVSSSILQSLLCPAAVHTATALSRVLHL